MNKIMKMMKEIMKKIMNKWKWNNNENEMKIIIMKNEIKWNNDNDIM